MNNKCGLFCCGFVLALGSFVRYVRARNLIGKVTSPLMIG